LVLAFVPIQKHDGLHAPTHTAKHNLLPCGYGIHAKAAISDSVFLGRYSVSNGKQSLLIANH